MNGKHELKQHHTSNVILAVLGVFLLAFIAIMIVTYWKTGGVPDTLIQYTMGAGGIESLALAAIKICKVRSGGKPQEGDQNGQDYL